MNTYLLMFKDAATFTASMPKGFTQNGETGAPLPDGVQAMSIIGSLATTDLIPIKVPGFFVIVLLPTTDTTNTDGSITSTPIVPANLAAYLTDWPINVTQRVFG